MEGKGGKDRSHCSCFTKAPLVWCRPWGPYRHSAHGPRLASPKTGGGPPCLPLEPPLGTSNTDADCLVQSLHHSALILYPDTLTMWTLSRVPRLREFIYAIDDIARQQLVHDVIDAFEQRVLPNIDQFSAGFIQHLSSSVPKATGLTL